MTRIYLIRHGEAEGNIFRRFHGQYDSLLTPRGHAQVACLRKRFENIHIDGCFSSDLTRTSLTARSIYLPKGLPLHRDKRFREVCVGVWEDVPYGYLDNFDEKRMWQFNHDPVNWRVEQAEDFDSYTQRFLEGMEAAAKAFDGGTIAIFAHGAAIRSTLMRLFFMDDLKKLPYSDNTGVSLLCYDKGVFTYEFLNDNSHIPEELSTFYIQRWWRESGKRKEAGIYFRDVREEDGLPVEDGKTRVGLLMDKCVGWVCLSEPENGIGKIRSLQLLDGYAGRYYADQLLGEAVSHFRNLGCTAVALQDSNCPDDLFHRYQFDRNDGLFGIDTGVFHWD